MFPICIHQPSSASGKAGSPGYVSIYDHTPSPSSWVVIGINTNWPDTLTELQLPRSAAPW